MTRRTRPARATKPAPSPFPEAGLAELGLAPGDTVRFRRRDSERWKQAVVARRERDGSIGLHDGRGASRSIAMDLIEVQTQGPRGGLVWEPLTARAARTEQIPLVRAKPVKRHIPLPDDREPDDGGADDERPPAADGTAPHDEQQSTAADDDRAADGDRACDGDVEQLRLL